MPLVHGARLGGAIAVVFDVYLIYVELIELRRVSAAPAFT
jgi:uncharacterized membrane protein